MDRLRECLCSRATEVKIKWWAWRLIPLAIVAVLLTAVIAVSVCFGPPPHINANVEDARLDTFDFATTQGSGTIFRYISVALAVRNTNRVSINYRKPLMATFVFHDRRLQELTVVVEGHKHGLGKTERHYLHATGEVQSFILGAAATEDFKQQNTTGLFKVEVRLSGRIATIKERTLSLSCPLELQLAPPGPEVVVFHEVNCKSDKHDKIEF